MNDLSNPKRILVFPFDLMSHYLRCIELMKRFPDSEVYFASSRKYNSHVSKAGFQLFDVESFDPAYVMQCTRKFDFSWMNTKDLERVFLSQVEVIKKLKPDLVIGDVATTLKMAAAYNAVPYHSLMNGYLSKYYAFTRKVSVTHPAYRIVSLMPKKLGERITRFAEGVKFKKVHKPFKFLRDKYQLKKVASYLDEIEGDRNYICDQLTLFPQQDLPDNYEVVGPLNTVVNQNESNLIDQLDHAKPWIVVSMGSSGDWKGVSYLNDSAFNTFQMIVAGDLEGVLKGPHIYSKDFVNLDEILPKAKALICHGGNGTIYKGIEHNVYMYCKSSHFEQEWNIHGLERMHLAESINTWKKKDLLKALRK